MIRFSEVQKWYGDYQALTDVTAQVRRGEVEMCIRDRFLPVLATTHADGTLPTRLELSHQARDAIQAVL